MASIESGIRHSKGRERESIRHSSELHGSDVVDVLSPSIAHGIRREDFVARNHLACE